MIEVKGNLVDIASNAAICVLQELIKLIQKGVRNIDTIYPVEIYFIKPNNHTCIIEAKNKLDDSLQLSNLFYPKEKKAHFDKRLEILHDCTRIKPFNQKWNKARLIIHDDQRYIFQYKFDRDIHAAYSVMQGQSELKRLDEETFKKIRTWEGLSNNHPRPWLSS
ncbi:hypothetical protein [Agarilytica rhodophyticola]|uniref:hypothetical protein n=1 Tax=Agarilytica rhodophyticola TaxID=1737490 RepID=UPI000CD8A52D|nr:hypothetical protein [Agarilytica rhodophyticola]